MPEAPARRGVAVIAPSCLPSSRTAGAADWAAVSPARAAAGGRATVQQGV
ncbi:hypothetical protein [Nocardia puris]|nr:hypothetical protein [Nocardia puris]